MKPHRSLSVIFGATALLTLSACNVFDPFDSPHNEAQYLSAARACFDRQEYECAREYYAKLAQTQPEYAAAEEAFLILDQEGAGMGPFMEVMAQGDASKGLTKMGGKLAALQPEKAKRARILAAYKNVSKITNDAALRGLVRFMSAFGLAAEILAETASRTGNALVVEKSDLVANPTTCAAATLSFATDAACSGTGTNLADSPTKPGMDLTNLSASDATTIEGYSGPMLNVLMGALKAIEYGLNEMGGAGKFQSGTGGFINQVDSIAASAANASQYSNAIRYGLITNGLGI